MTDAKLPQWKFIDRFESWKPTYRTRCRRDMFRGLLCGRVTRGLVLTNRNDEQCVGTAFTGYQNRSDGVAARAESAVQAEVSLVRYRA